MQSTRSFPIKISSFNLSVANNLLKIRDQNQRRIVATWKVALPRMFLFRFEQTRHVKKLVNKSTKQINFSVNFWEIIWQIYSFVTSDIVEFREKTMGKKSKDPWCHWCKNRKSILGHSSIDCPNRKCPLCTEKGHTRQYCPGRSLMGNDIGMASG